MHNIMLLFPFFLTPTNTQHRSFFVHNIGDHGPRVAVSTRCRCACCKVLNGTLWSWSWRERSLEFESALRLHYRPSVSAIVLALIGAQHTCHRITGLNVSSGQARCGISPKMSLLPIYLWTKTILIITSSMWASVNTIRGVWTSEFFIGNRVFYKIDVICQNCIIECKWHGVWRRYNYS